MQDTPRNIYTKFGSNQSSSSRGEEICIIVNDDDGRQQRRRTTTDDDRRQVMAIAHMAFGQVRLKLDIFAFIFLHLFCIITAVY